MSGSATSLARTGSADATAAMLSRLGWRNRIVGLLRVAVPAVGVVAFLALVGQIYLANLARQYGVSGIRIDRGNLVVETPQYSGIGTDGSRYVINASEARSPIDNTNLITMSDATLDLTSPGKTSFHAAATTATTNTASNIVTVPGVATITSDDGLHGTLTKVRSDMRAEITTADGPVDITFADGTTIQASSMHFNGKTAVWTFKNSTLVIQNLPKSSGAPSAETVP